MKLYSKSILIIILGLLFIFSPDKIEAKTITVCPAGCNYSTIAQAETASVSGDTVIVKPGTYSGFTITKQITVEAEVYDRNNPRNNQTLINSQVYIQGGSWAWNGGPVIRGFHITSYDAVRGKQTPYTLEYSFIESPGQGSDGISFESAGGVIRGNHVDVGGDDCIDVDSQTTDILIENNYLKNCNQDGIEVRQQPNSIAQRVTLTIKNNRIESTGQDGFQIMDYTNFSNRRYIVQGNLFIGSGSKSNGAGIGIMVGENTTEDFSAAAMPEPLYAINNTFASGDAGISGGANLIAVNNIFSGLTVFDLKNVNGKSKVMNSLFASSPKLQGTNNIDNTATKTGNPNFDSQFRIQAGSPAIDAGLARYQHSYTYNGSLGGSTQTYTEYAVDLASSQYSGSAPDIGFSESGLSLSPPPTGIQPTNPQPSQTGKPGDANGDNLVDGLDYVLWLQNYNTSASSVNKGDFNGNGFVDGLDYVIWLQNYNK